MKNIFVLLVLSLSLTSCYKDATPIEPPTEADKLPPETQIGSNKIGCLLDGKAFMPGYYGNSTDCFYQYVHGGYYFAVHFNNKDSNYNLTSLGIFTRKKEIHEGETYNLIEYEDGNASGDYIFNAADPVYTNYINTGELKITKLDQVKGIVSGTFWFDVEDKQGVVHQIREGRFDMHYTN